MVKDKNRLKHLYYRAGFGRSLEQYKAHQKDPISHIFNSSTAFKPIDVIEHVHVEKQDMPSMDQKMTASKKVLKRQDIVFLNTVWSGLLYNSEGFLREKMSLLWHDHFACRVQVPGAAQQHVNVLRRYALNPFGDLLMAVSKNPAMLYFLNNQQNKKDSPNENFAREVLELFTLGRGHYTEADIKNAARAFTGWGSNRNGEFRFATQVHDYGEKTFRGKSGNFTGEDIIAMLLEDKQTARFVTEKIWQHIVSTEVKDEEIISSLSNSLHKSDYHIQKLLKEIFTSEWFYEERFVGNLIKTPLEFITGVMNHTQGEFVNPDSIVYIQRTLGQILFAPPNVGGWPTGKEWIDSSSLTFRMSLPNILFKKTTTNVKAKDDGDVNNATNKANASRLAFQMDWEPHAKTFVKENSKHTIENIQDYLLSRPTSAHNLKWVSNFTDNSSNDIEFVKKAFIGFMSLPEYQLC